MTKIVITFKVYFFLRFYLFTFRQRGKEGEREGEKHQCVVACHVLPPTGDLACNQVPGLGTQPARPFGSQAGTQPTH